MDIIVHKSDEDCLLNDCDDSCGSGVMCVARKMLGMSISGKGMHCYGFSKCVLCMRRYHHRKSSRATQYRVIQDGYPVAWVVNGCFIRFDIRDYVVCGPRSVVQRVDTNEVIHPDSWITKMYNTHVVKVPIGSNRWFISVCDTGDCKHNIHAFIDIHRAIGTRSSFMDLDTMSVKCEFCKSTLRKIHDKGGLVSYDGIMYARCRFCSTVVKYSDVSPIQMCTTCRVEQGNELKMFERVCLHCNNTVPTNKKNGSQTIIVKIPNGGVKEIFLCRHHKINMIVDKKVYDYDYVLSILK
jgi:hypothetical protein